MEEQLTKLTEIMKLSFTANDNYSVIKFYSNEKSNLTNEQVKYAIDSFTDTLFSSYATSNNYFALPTYFFDIVDKEENLLCLLRIFV